MPLELLSAGSSNMVGVVSDVQALHNRAKICFFSAYSILPKAIMRLIEPKSRLLVCFMPLNRINPEQRQLLCARLGALSKHKSDLQTDLGTVWQEWGSAVPHVFFYDWEIHSDKSFVVGSVTSDNDKIIADGPLPTAILTT